MRLLQMQLADMLHQRETWLELLYGFHALDSRHAVEQSWLELAQHAIERLEAACGPGLSAELFELVHHATRNLATVGDVDEQAGNGLPDGAPPGDDIAARLALWQRVARLLCTKGGTFRKQVTRKEGFPTRDNNKKRVAVLLDEFRDDTELLEALQTVLQVPNPILDDTEWARLQALQLVLPALAQELYVIMAERNCSDYDELTRRAIDALGTPEHPSDLALIQDYRIRHILMDEFQDTSPTQLRLLHQLTAGWQPELGDRSLFLVGDPMQSIYGFRKADVRVFLNATRSGIGDIPLQPLQLQVNFRSSPDIIDWVNRIMPSVFSREGRPRADACQLYAVRSCAGFHRQGTYPPVRGRVRPAQ